MIPQVTAITILQSLEFGILSSDAGQITVAALLSKQMLNVARMLLKKF
jgi:hypothetical protein